MTWLKDDATTFMDEFLSGFCAQNRDTVSFVPKAGVRRRAKTYRGKVVVVIGGGSGHYPAFTGLVGVGLADAAVCGNIFASPSSNQVEQLCHAVNADGGILLTFGNYSGDVLHFGLAERRLRSNGIDVRTVLVTDDIASAPAAQHSLRRGIAGDLFVFKVAGAAAEADLSLDEVEQVALLANANTFTLGVAFQGCTLPGADQPLFEIPTGMMSVGMGIHGEPGITEEPVPTAPELAKLLVERLLAERPQGAGSRVALLVNGLGSVPYEEIFAVFGHAAKILNDAGLSIVAPECGELVTSLDMAGLSITISWLNEELEEFWTAPANAPAFKRFADTAPTPSTNSETGSLDDCDSDTGNSDPDYFNKDRASQELTFVEMKYEHRDLIVPAVRIFAAIDQLASQAERRWGDLDSVAGDGDHGLGMRRGAQAAALEAVQTAENPENSLSTLLSRAGRAFSDAAGGTSGAIWGIILESLALTLGESDTMNRQTLRNAIDNAYKAVVELGGARVGDKTIVDAFAALKDAFTVSPDSAVDTQDDLLKRAIEQTTQAAKQTADLRPRLGRARPLAEKSLGHPDPGAVSFAEITSIVFAQLGEKSR